ncbi:25268_t:CDS:1, partial [Racocetra persica]
VVVNKKDKMLSKLEEEKASINNKRDFKERVKEDEVEKYLQQIVKLIIDIEETKEFLDKVLAIAGLQAQQIDAELDKKNNSEEVIGFRNSVFKRIVEKGIDYEIARENPLVPYSDLTGDPKEDISQIVNEQDKLNALKVVLKEIKEKRQVIIAENILQEIIDKLTPSED